MSSPMKVRIATVLAIVLLGSLAGPAGAALFQNGDFEDKPLSPADYPGGIVESNRAAFDQNLNSTSVTGWVSTTTNIDPGQWWRTNFVINQSISGHPLTPDLFVHEGAQAVLLNGDGIQTSISQTFDTTPGRVYAATFMMGHQNGTPGNSRMVVEATGNPALQYASTKPDYAMKTYQFLAAGASTTLSFTQSGGGGDDSVLLDDVQVNQPAALPFRNGGFEDKPLIAANYPDGIAESNRAAFDQNLNSTSVTGWVSTTTNTSSGDWWRTNFVINRSISGYPLTPDLFVHEGDQAVLLNGDGGATTGISQTFATVPGCEYVVSFMMGHQAGTPGDSLMLVQATGNPAEEFLSTQPDYALKLYQFLADGPSTTLSFTQSTGGGNDSVLLDDVQVRALTVIPEPATIGLLGLGLAGLGGYARRRRAA